MRRAIRWLTVVCGMTLATPVPAHAFHPMNMFVKPIAEGGGNKIFFTGSDRWQTYDCSVCHIDPAGRITFTIESDPPELMEEQRWEPNVEYRIVVRLEGEHLVHETNLNSFLIEFDTDDAQPVGRYFGESLQPPTGYDGMSAEGVAAGRAAFGNEWSFWWLSPYEGTGRLTMYLAGLDGNGAGEAGDADPDLHSDPWGDDVFSTRLRICEGDDACDLGFSEGLTVVGVGCAGASTGPRESPLRLLWLLVLPLAYRRVRVG